MAETRGMENKYHHSQCCVCVAMITITERSNLHCATDGCTSTFCLTIVKPVMIF